MSIPVKQNSANGKYYVYLSTKGRHGAVSLQGETEVTERASSVR